MRSSAKLSRFRAVGTNERLALNLLGEHLRTRLKRPCNIRSETRVPQLAKGVSHLIGEAKLTRCLKVWVSSTLEL